MSERSILAVPGLASTGPAFLFALWELAARNGWDADALAAVMSGESGFKPSIKNPLPGQTASGLIQFTESTANSLGTTTAAIRAMGAVEQLGLVERYYKRAFGGRAVSLLRPADYYAAVWGNGVGKPLDAVLARESDPRTRNGGADNLYSLNKGLDVNKDGEIRLQDLADHVASTQAKAGGRRIEVPLVRPVAAPAAPASVEPLPSAPRPSQLPSSSAPFVPLKRAALPVLCFGSFGPAVEAARILSGYEPGDRFDSGFRSHLAAFGAVFTSDHVLGAKTWAAILKRQAVNA